MMHLITAVGRSTSRSPSHLMNLIFLAARLVERLGSQNQPLCITVLPIPQSDNTFRQKTIRSSFLHSSSSAILRDIFQHSSGLCFLPNFIIDQFSIFVKGRHQMTSNDNDDELLRVAKKAVDILKKAEPWAGRYGHGPDGI